ncbi:arginine N-succinyltransferase [Shewanella cyperi]|uniref:arginine N-succinyltransferase n=1 Tax=Shewanella cyperi TaxID=2814292 RepID=UPI001A942591|nr:arginine N-succinyltransferase [Shewanella cyperi]QSX41372.1 arginine N-succinyltransferase [Shewanella cyperi]
MFSFQSGPRRQLSSQRGFTGVQVLLMLLATVVITVAVSFFVIRAYIFPKPLEPVTLSAKEEQKLEQKLSVLGWQSDSGSRTDSNKSSGKGTARRGSNDLTPEPYREADGDRRVTFSEKEVNAMIGRNPDFAHRVAIDFSDDLASAKILVPIPQDFPVMAGEILRVNAGLDIHLDSRRRPVVALVGVSLMGVPIPNAWLGNIKNVNLVSEFGDRGFWNTFADGVEDIQISEGELYIKLRK